MSERPLAIDLDGTIIDAKPRQVAVVQAAARAVLGSELDGPAFWRHKRAGATTLQALRLLAVDDRNASLIDFEWRRRIEDPEWMPLDRPLPGALATLATICEISPVTILTARERIDGTRAVLRSLHLDQIVGLVVVSPQAATQQKAEALRTMRATGFIGDSESDGEAARLSQVPFLAVDTGQREARYLEARGYEVAPTMQSAWEHLNKKVGRF